MIKEVIELNNKYWAKIGIRFLQAIFIVAAVFGAIWKATLAISLSIQGFLMLYGVMGTLVCEVAVRLLEWKFPESEKKTVREEEPQREEE